MNLKNFQVNIFDLIIISILSIISIFIYCFHIQYPSKVVFDEVYFGNFTKYYLTGEYFFDIHPPLGKLILSLFGYLFHFDPSTKFIEISQSYQNPNYLILRMIPAILGSLKSPLLYFSARILNISMPYSILIGLMCIFDNSLISESRHILLEGILTFFTSLSILFISLIYYNENLLLIIFSSIIISIHFVSNIQVVE